MPKNTVTANNNNKLYETDRRMDRQLLTETNIQIGKVEEGAILAPYDKQQQQQQKYKGSKYS